MKKLFAILLCSVLVLSLLAACGGEGTEVTTSDGNTVVENKDGTISLELKYASIGEPSEKTEAKVGENGKHVQSISAKEETVYIEAGKVGQVEAVIAPTDATDPSLYYKSDNEAVAKVDKDGKVLGVEAGATTITIITNDRNFKTKVDVIVYRVKTNDEKVNEMLGMINQARTDAELTALEVDPMLNAAATERAFEEAAENDNKMDDTRPLKDASGNAKAHSTILKDFDIWSRGQTRLYIWKTKASVKDAFDGLMANEDNKNLLLSEDGKYSYIGAGCFEYKDVAYWCVLMYLK